MPLQMTLYTEAGGYDRVSRRCDYAGFHPAAEPCDGAARAVARSCCWVLKGLATASTYDTEECGVVREGWEMGHSGRMGTQYGVHQSLGPSRERDVHRSGRSDDAHDGNASDSSSRTWWDGGQSGTCRRGRVPRT